MVLKNFTKITGKHLCQSLYFKKSFRLRAATLLKKRLWHSCFPRNFGKFSGTLFWKTPLDDCFWFSEFYYLTNLHDNLSTENKIIVLLKDFIADRLKHDKDCNVSDFLDTMCRNLLLPHIASPTLVTIISGILIDNIFSNNCDSFFTSQKLATTLSDYHAHFLWMEFETKQMDTEKIQAYRDFIKIEYNKKLMDTHYKLYWLGSRVKCKS